MRVRTPSAFVPLTAVLLLSAAPVDAQDRIFVDQYMPLRSELMIADTDGANPRKLVPGGEIDYNPSFSADGQWVVFTSDRTGSADIFRTRLDGTAVERLTDSPAFDDQAALSPDGESLAFVSTRGDGSNDIYIMDLGSGRVRNLTNAPGGDFRPSWSPDGQTIAFSSDRGTGFPHQDYPGPAGNWEHVQAASVYLINTDGTGLRQLTTDPEMMAGSPRWSSDGRSIVFYEMPVLGTFQAHFGVPASSIVSIDVATGERTVHASSPGLKVAPHFIGPDRIAYYTKTRGTGTLGFTSGEAGLPRDLSSPSWSHDGTRVVYQAGQLETMHHYSNTPGRKLLGTVADPGFDLVHASGWPAVSPDGRTLVVSERTPSDDRMALVMWDIDGTNPRRVYDADVTVMGLEWSRDGEWLTFGAGSFFLERSSGTAEIMIMRPDGSDARAVTKEAGNAGFPSWSPDGTHIVYRYWTNNEQGEGLRIVEVASGESCVLTTEYDTLPLWSPKGDQIMFTRYAPDDRFPYDEFDIWSIRPDGTGLKRLTDAEGNDAHSLWSPDGEQILFSSSRFGYKDESPLTINQPQPYAELFIMDADGSNQRALTDNRYEEGTPAWVPGNASRLPDVTPSRAPCS
jgi:Tol biopolymer transport system component